MPVIRTSERRLDERHRPGWCTVAAAGVFCVPREGGRFDRHYHDGHEYWLIYKGKAKIFSEGCEYYVKAGDIVATQAGEEHDVIEVYEDFEAFYFEDTLIPPYRMGHLHRSQESAKGHDVAALPVPADFPR